MGRLPALMQFGATTVGASALALSVALIACEKDSDAPKAPPPTSRSEVVTSAGPAAAASVTPKVPEHPAEPVLRKPRKLCESPPPGAGRSIPKDKLDRLEATGTAEAAQSALAVKARWTWVNLWASWCAPCKRELPIILSMQSKLAAIGTPVTLDFVSIDDDRKQGQAYVLAQPAGGLRSSYWLSDTTKAKWLGALKVSETTPLPVQLLFDSQGALRCEIDGDIGEDDYAQLLTLFSSK